MGTWNWTIVFLVALTATLSHAQDDPVDRETDVRNLVVPGLWPVYVMYTFFLNIVQLTYFNEIADKLEFTSFEEMADTFGSDWEEWLIYFIGFTICIAVGIVGFFAMLFAGMITPCCRCCNHCGGKQKRKDGKRSHGERIGCSVTLVVFNCILVLGVVCMFFTNDEIRNQLEGDNTVFDNIAKGVGGLEPYLDDTVKEMNVSVLGKFQEGSKIVLTELELLPNTTLDALNNETGIITIANTLSDFSAQLYPLKYNLDNITTRSTQLQSDAGSLNVSIAAVKSDILTKLQTCTDAGCYAAGNVTEALELNVNYGVVNVTSAELAIQIAIDGDLQQYVNNITATLNDIYQVINDSTSAAIQETEKEIVKIEQEILDFVVQLDDGVNDVVVQLDNVVSTMNDVEVTVDEENIAQYVYFSILCLGVVFCLIIFTNMAGVLHVFCPRPNKGEFCCRCSKAQGSRWLLASAGLTFIVYWIFILIVMLLFAMGGLSYTEICRNVVYYNDSKSAAVLDTFDTLINNSLSSDITIYIFDTYQMCEEDASLYDAFMLAENGYNITELIDITAIEATIDELKKTKVNVPTIYIYTASLETILAALDAGAALDYGSMKTELQKAVTTVNMTDLANQLDDLTSVDLTAEIQALRGLDADADTITALAAETVPYVDFVIANMPTNFTTISVTVESTETFVNTQGDQFASGVINSTADRVSTAVVALTNDIIFEVENEIGACRPLYTSMTYLVDAVCVSAMYPVNSLWFSLGWCLFFLIPHLVLTFKLSKLFRKTERYKPKAAAYMPDEMTLERVRDNKPVAYASADEISAKSQGSRNSAFDSAPYDPLEAYRKEMIEMSADPRNLHIPRPNIGKPPAYTPEVSNNPWIPTGPGQGQGQNTSREVDDPWVFKKSPYWK